MGGADIASREQQGRNGQDGLRWVRDTPDYSVSVLAVQSSDCADIQVVIMVVAQQDCIQLG